MRGGEAVDLYTSFETSLALEEAGAPQDRETTAWASNPTYWCDDIGEYGHPIGRHFGCHGNTHPRAYRSDEIIEALGDRFNKAEWLSTSRWEVVVFVGPRWADAIVPGASLVEALAAAWLAVLKEGK